MGYMKAYLKVGGGIYPNNVIYSPIRDKVETTLHTHAHKHMRTERRAQKS